VEEPKALLEALRATRFHYTSEDDLQRGIAKVLETAGIPHQREFRLGAQSRLDFMVEGGLGIEVKIDGSAMDLGYQVLRYLKDEAVKGIVVVTTRSSHRDLPRELEGKPIWVLYLFASAF
jgi:hypothetical protein